MKALFVGCGLDYGPGAGPESGRILVYTGNDEDWSSMVQRQEFIPADGCNAVEWVELHPSGKTLYANCCYWNFKPTPESEQKPGQLCVFSIDPETAELILTKTLPSGGHQPCHATISPDRTLLAIAHYLNGSISLFQVDHETGALLNETPTILMLPYLDGMSPPKERVLGAREPQPLAHCVCFSACGHWLAVCDAGQNQVVVWSLTTTATTTPKLVSVNPVGMSRPRHCLFSSSGDTIFIIFEKENMVASYTFEDSGKMITDKPLAKTSTLKSPETSGGQMCSALISLSDNFLVATNRAINHSMILEIMGKKSPGTEASAVVIDAKTLHPIHHIQAGFPASVGDARQCIQAQDGGLLVALQVSNQVLYFTFDEEAGILNTTPIIIENIKAPLCIAMWQTNKRA